MNLILCLEFHFVQFSASLKFVLATIQLIQSESEKRLKINLTKFQTLIE